LITWADWEGRVNESWSDDFEVLHWVIERFESSGHRIEVGEDGKGWVVKKQLTAKSTEGLDLGDVVVHRGERGE